MLHVSEQGLCRCCVNGVRVGADVRIPGWVRYDTWLPFQSNDIGNLLIDGSNQIEMWLGNGWHRSQLMWDQGPINNCSGDHLDDRRNRS